MFDLETVVVQQTELTVLKKIAQGGFGTVFLVKDWSNNRFALKRVITNSKSVIDLTKTEIELLDSFTHDNIIRLMASDVYLHHGKTHIYMLLEYCPADLVGLMQHHKSGATQIADGLIGSIFLQLVKALDAVHKRDWVHRDIKVENILFTDVSYNELKLCDFGSCTAEEIVPQTSSEISHVTTMVEKYTTPLYRAPEMYDPWRKQIIGKPSDIWALGVVLYYLCTLETPFPEENPKLAVLNNHYVLPDGVASEYRTIIRACLMSDPMQRPTTDDLINHMENGTPLGDTSFVFETAAVVSETMFDPFGFVTGNPAAETAATPAKTTLSATFFEQVAPQPEPVAAKTQVLDGFFSFGSEPQPSVVQPVTQPVKQPVPQAKSEFGEKAARLMDIAVKENVQNKGFFETMETANHDPLFSLLDAAPAATKSPVQSPKQKEEEFFCVKTEYKKHEYFSPTTAVKAATPQDKLEEDEEPSDDESDKLLGLKRQPSFTKQKIKRKIGRNGYELLESPADTTNEPPKRRTLAFSTGKAIKKLTDSIKLVGKSDIEIAVRKACSREIGIPKMKHINSLSVHLQESTRNIQHFYDFIQSCITRDAVVLTKALCVLLNLLHVTESMNFRLHFARFCDGDERDLLSRIEAFSEMIDDSKLDYGFMDLFYNFLGLLRKRSQLHQTFSHLEGNLSIDSYLYYTSRLVQMELKAQDKTKNAFSSFTKSAVTICIREEELLRKNFEHSSAWIQSLVEELSVYFEEALRFLSLFLPYFNGATTEMLPLVDALFLNTLRELFFLHDSLFFLIWAIDTLCISQEFSYAYVSPFIANSIGLQELVNEFADKSDLLERLTLPVFVGNAFDLSNRSLKDCPVHPPASLSSVVERSIGEWFPSLQVARNRVSEAGTVNEEEVVEPQHITPLVANTEASASEAPAVDFFAFDSVQEREEEDNNSKNSTVAAPQTPKKQQNLFEMFGL
ncbi:hypothetical protein PCE1_002407 [Barthelona sp. PCE]